MSSCEVTLRNGDDSQSLEGAFEKRMARRAKRSEKKAERRVVAPAKVDQQLNLFETVKESVLVQKIWDLLSLLWAKILELEEKLEVKAVESFERMAALIEEMRPPVPVKEFYSTKEFSRIMGVKPETLRKYLNDGKIEGEKLDVGGRGEYGEYKIPHSERLRLPEEGMKRKDPFAKKKPDRAANKNLKQYQKQKNLPR